MRVRELAEFTAKRNGEYPNFKWAPPSDWALDGSESVEKIENKCAEDTSVRAKRGMCEALATLCVERGRRALANSSPTGSAVPSDIEGQVAAPEPAVANSTEGVPGPIVEAVPEAQFSRSGRVWTIKYGAESTQLPHLAGLEYIAILLRQPLIEFSPIQVEALSKSDRARIPISERHDSDRQESGYDGDDLHTTDGYGSEVGVDPRARQEYKKRAKELSTQIQGFRDRGYGDESEPISTRISELEDIENHLKAATGLHSRSRKEGGELEKARKRVTKNIDRAIKKIADPCPKTADHLTNTIKTGISMIYRDGTIAWKL
jgi:hypothetical protein